MHDSRGSFLWKICRGTISTIVPLVAAIFSCVSASCDELVILSPHWEGIKSEFGREFQLFYREERGREVQLRWLDVGGGTSDILRFLRTQYRATPQGVGIDLFFGGGTEPYLALKKEGLLAPCVVDPKIWSALGKEIRGVSIQDEDRFWYSAALSTFGILFNKRVLDLLSFKHPTDWSDLADPKLEGWLSLADPRKSGSAHMIYELLLQRYGWEEGWRLIRHLGILARNFSASAGRTVEDVTLGEAAATFTIDSYGAEAQQRAGVDLVEFRVPQDSLLVTGDGIAVLKGAPSPDIARLFLEFTLSKRGQQLLFLRKGTSGGPEKFELRKLPVIPSLYLETEEEDKVVDSNPFSSTSTFKYDQSTATARWELLNELIGSFVVDVHSNAKEFYRKSPSDVLSSLNPPLSPEDLKKTLNVFESQGQAAKITLLETWKKAAREEIPEGENRWVRAAPLISIFVIVAFLILRERRSLGGRRVEGTSTP